MLTNSEYIKKVQDAISAIDFGKEPKQLYEPIAYTMEGGGKRLRPVLLLMACDAMGGDVDKALPAAVGLELYHNFTLLHDDVMDCADVRRGKPTVYKKWNSNAAILSGDAMLTLASQYITGVDTAVLRPVVELFNRTALEVDEGQQLDMDFEVRDDVRVKDYMEMIRLKTSVLLACACKIGAIVAGASSADADALYEMGENLGLAFQLQDDVLDVWGDEATFGKAIGGDILNNKKTFLLINAAELAQGDTALELRRWVNDSFAIGPDKIAAVTSIYEKLGLRELSEKAIENYTEKSIAALNRVVMPAEAHDAFVTLIKSMVGRNK